MFHKFAANWTADTVVMVKNLETFGTEGVAAMDEDAGNALTDIEVFAAVVAVV